IQFVVNDGVSNSNLATANVAITSTNNAPTIDLDLNDSGGATGANYQTTFVEGGGPVTIVDSVDADLSDLDNGNLASLTVTITNPLDAAAESLSAVTTGTSITASFASGTLTLSGVDTVSNYRQVLRTIQYQNTSLSPTTTTRVVQFVVNDGVSNSNLATANVAITPTNSAPVISVPGTQNPLEDTPWSISGISVNDPDIGAGMLQFSVNVGRGTLSIDVNVAGGLVASEVIGNGSASVVVTSTLAKLNTTLAATNGVTYLCNPNATGADTVVVTASDFLMSTNATVTLNITPTNDAPIAGKDQYFMDPDSTLTVAPAGLLANDFDIDGDALSVVLVNGPTSGTLTLGTDGSFQFTPEKSFSGEVSFSYAVMDGMLASAPTTVAIQVALPISPADIISAKTSTEPVEIVDEPPTEDEETTEATTEQSILTQVVVNEFESDVPLVLTSRAVVQTTDDPTFSMGAMQQRVVDLSNNEAESDVASESSGFDEYAARQRNSESSRSSLSIQGIASFDSKLLWDDITDLGDQITGADDTPYYFAGSFAGFSGALSVGYVMWTVRGGLLATSLLAHLPAWSFVDPLLVLDEMDDDQDSDDDSLEEMLDKNEKEREDDSPIEASSSTGETSQ
ncbi:MAG: tandem-95 repeat protein, partial [Planctomycetales bacterium]|nr:tandem-95 repeat protein [Planctomycetales bacterium]